MAGIDIDATSKSNTVRPRFVDDNVMADVECDDEGGVRHPKKVQNPKMPSRAEVDLHELTHLPYRSWCKHCVRGRGESHPQCRTDRDEDAVAELHLDYCFLGKRDEDVQPVLVARERDTRMTLSFLVKEMLSSEGKEPWSSDSCGNTGRQQHCDDATWGASREAWANPFFAYNSAIAENDTAEELCYTDAQLSNAKGERTAKEQSRIEKSTVACLRNEVKKQEPSPYYLEMRKVIPMIFAFIALIPMVIIL